MPKGGRGPYKKGYRTENRRRKFWEKHFGRFGEGCKRSYGSRGHDITFFDYQLRRWTVSCKVKKIPKWMLDEVEGHDILDIHVDRIGDFSFLPSAKLEELLRAASEPPRWELTKAGEEAIKELYAPIKVRAHD